MRVSVMATLMRVNALPIDVDGQLSGGRETVVVHNGVAHPPQEGQLLD